MRTNLTASEEQVASMNQSGRIVCPQCGPDRRHTNPTLNVTVEAEHTLYNCHHCGWSGAMSTARPLNDYIVQKREKVSPIPTQLNRDNNTISQFFENRGVKIDDMSVLPPMSTGIKSYRDGKDQNGKEKWVKLMSVGFVYGDPTEPEGIKWRSVEEKRFTQDGCSKSLYGLDQLDPEATEIIIVEGECDVIALSTIGIKAVSVPNGAPSKLSDEGRVRPEDDVKYSYLFEAYETLERVDSIILATDNDKAGDALAEEIMRRTERAKCKRVEFPEGCKDANDVLEKHGAEALTNIVDAAVEVPLEGIYGASDYSKDIIKFYNEGHARGESTGIRSLDELFSIGEGQLIIVTGIPGNGKSEFCDQLMTNVALTSHWKWAVASFENPVKYHCPKICEKLVGKPFNEGHTPRMTMAEMENAMEFIDDHFVFLDSKEGKMATVDSIISRCKSAIKRLGVRGLIIDPFTYIDQEGADSERKFIGLMLTKLTSFAQAYGVTILFVAHPTKLRQKDDGTFPVPNGHHISGSADFFNKADVGLTVHRGQNGVEIHCWKVRHKFIGQTGMRILGYDIPTGRYFDGQKFGTTGEHTDNFRPNKFTHWQETDFDDDDEMEF
jgi:twinkle protein